MMRMNLKFKKIISVALVGMMAIGIGAICLAVTNKYTSIPLLSLNGVRHELFRWPLNWPFYDFNEPQIYTIGDLNNDGKDDLAFGISGDYYDDRVIVFLTSPHHYGFSKVLTRAFLSPRLIDIGDYNNDKKNELMVLGEENITFLTVEEDLPDETYLKKCWVGAPSPLRDKKIKVASLRMQDIDHDGNSELLILSEDNRIYIFEIRAKSVQLEWKSEIFPLKVASYLFDDIDNDGVSELCIGTAVTKANPRVLLQIFKYDGKNYNLIQSNIIKGEVYNITNIVSEDVNGDGEKELILKVYLSTEYMNAYRLKILSFIPEAFIQEEPKWLWESKSLYSETFKFGRATYFSRGPFIYDLDSNGVAEIITNNSSGSKEDGDPHIVVFEWDGKTYTQKWKSEIGYKLFGLGRILYSDLTGVILSKRGELESLYASKRITLPIKVPKLNLSELLKKEKMPALVSSWGEAGKGAGQFDRPEEITIDSKGFIYVADAGNDRIQKFDSEGNFILAWGKRGKSPSDVLLPKEVEAYGGAIYLIEFAGPYVLKKFSPEGKFIESWRKYDFENFRMSADDVAFSSQGEIYFAKPFFHYLEKFTPDRKQIYNLEKLKEFDLRGAAHIAPAVFVDKKDNAYLLLENDTIIKLDPAGNIKQGFIAKQHGLTGGVTDIAVDERGFIYVCTKSRIIEKYSPDGAFVYGFIIPIESTLKKPEFGLEAITLDNKGHIYVVDSEGNQVLKYKLPR